MTVTFEISGRPQAKQRPRVTRNGHAFTPKETVMYENLVKMEYERQIGKKLEGAIYASIYCLFEPPKSTSKKKREEMLSQKIHYTKKPDCDNLAKSILDSLNGVAYDDDSQIRALYVSKAYSEESKVIVSLTSND